MPDRPAAPGRAALGLPASAVGEPVLAQMELRNSYQVPRHRSATASVVTMLLSGLLAALVKLPLIAGSTPAARQASPEARPGATGEPPS